MIKVREIWDAISERRRLEIARCAGWETGKGKPDRTARKISRLRWDTLSPAVRNVLIRFKELER